VLTDRSGSRDLTSFTGCTDDVGYETEIRML